MQKTELNEIYLDLKFDKSDLNSVWMNQATVFFKYSLKSALMEEQASKAKMELEAFESQLYESFRIEKEHNSYKWSENTISSKIKKHPEYIKKQQAFLILRRDADIYKSAMEALRHRRDMIVQASKAAIVEFEKLDNQSFQSPVK